MPKSVFKPLILTGCVLALAAVAAAVFFQTRSAVSLRQRRGVEIWKPDKVQEGYNLVVRFETAGPGCSLVDLAGEEVKVLPGDICTFTRNGDLLTSIFGPQDGANLARIGAEGIQWKAPIFVSHDARESAVDGSVWALTHRILRRGGKNVRDDLVVGYSASGKPISTWSLLRNLNEYARVRGEKIPVRKDVLPDGTTADARAHFNSVYVIDDPRWEKRNPAFKAGRLLISDNYAQGLFVLDPPSGKIVWFFKVLPGRYQHSARMTPEGNILFFYNNITHSVDSVAREFDIQDGKTVWQFAGSPGVPVTSEMFGSAQRLPNGNTLISYITDAGGAVEVTSKGEPVWKWTNRKLGRDGILPSKVYRVERVPSAIAQKWLKEI